MKDRFNEMISLHSMDEPLLVANCWDALSASLTEKFGSKMVATSSAGVAESLGYADGEQMSFDEYLFVVKRITASVSLPVSVDLETGYADTPGGIAANIKQLYEAGVSGINIEDSVVNDGKRTILPVPVFAEKIKSIKSILNETGISFFINIRCDSFLAGLDNALHDACERIPVYEKTGANGIFLPCIEKLTDIKTITALSTLPVNVMCVPGLPSLAELKKAAVKRISMGPFLSRHAYKSIANTFAAIKESGNFESLF